MAIGHDLDPADSQILDPAGRTNIRKVLLHCLLHALLVQLDPWVAVVRNELEFVYGSNDRSVGN